MIIVDIQDEIFQNNNLFNKLLWGRYIGTELWGRLYDLCEINNIEIITADYALNNYHDLSGCSLISIEITCRTEILIKKGVKPKILISGESPIFAWEFFVNLNKHGALFESLMLPKGVVNFAPKLASKIQQTSFPIPKKICSKIQNYDEWKTRARACVIISNRVWRPRGFKHLQQILKTPVIAKSLYEKRNKAIITLSKTGLVELYGRGWGNYVLGGNVINYYKLKRLWKGELDIKDSGMAGYKFAICYENTDFPGYVTEKIFDSLAAGTIPIYYGSDYIKEILPKELYIDVKEFNSIHDVGEYINTFSADNYRVFHDTLIHFCKSKEFNQNTYEARAEKIFNTVNT